MNTSDKIDKLLHLSKKRDALTRAMNTLILAKQDIRATLKNLPRQPDGHRTYGANRTACVLVEIDAALKGLRKERGNIGRAIGNIGRARTEDE